MNSGFSLEEYQIQRKYREEKRKEYLRKFELLKQKKGIISQRQEERQVSEPLQYKSPKENKIMHSGQQELAQQNELLKAQLAELQQKQRGNLQNFKSKIADVKGKYIKRITDINKLATEQQNSNMTKIQKLVKQIQDTTSKNNQIEEFNTKIKDQLQGSNQIIGKYATEIKNQYATKLEEFEKIFNSSTEKIEAMEKQFDDDDQFIKSTLQNQELIETIKQNADKASDDVYKLLGDYQEIFQGKSEILNQMNINNEMKAKQIAKMSELEQKLKAVFDKINAEKKIYIEQNTKMAQQLVEIKDMLMGGIKQ